jgi:hypothetical protein
MKSYSIDKRFMYTGRSISKGAQEKYLCEGYYYKIDKEGNEGLVEYLVSLVLGNSTLSENEYVKYEMCKINGKNGCRAKNFLEENEEFITMSLLYQKWTGNTNLSDKLAAQQDAGKRLQYLMNLVKQVGINVEKFKYYLQTVMQLDLLTENVDRHSYNYGVIYNSSKASFRLAPIFDNGQALHTVKRDVYTAATISGSFHEQVTVFGFPVVPMFQINYGKLYKELDCIDECKELNFLREQLEKYRSIFELKSTRGIESF